jgi:hypothetical protein
MFDAPQVQLEAYNARDIEAFMRCYTDDCRAEDGAGALLFAGASAMRARYTKMFADSPTLRCALVSRVRRGRNQRACVARWRAPPASCDGGVPHPCRWLDRACAFLSRIALRVFPKTAGCFH